MPNSSVFQSIAFAAAMVVVVTCTMQATNTVAPPQTPSPAPETTPATPVSAVDATAVDPDQDPPRADVFYLIDVSRSIHSGRAAPFAASVAAIPASIEFLRTSDAFLPQRHRVATIGALSLDQRPLCDIRIGSEVFKVVDTTLVHRRINACALALRVDSLEGETDITGSLELATRALNSRPPGRGSRRVVVVISDLKQELAPGRKASVPNLTGLCVAVYSVVTRETAADPNELARREAEMQANLEEWNAKSVMVRSLIGFDPASLSSFIRSCGAKD